jgi:SAM-dependent methyltransferase
MSLKQRIPWWAKIYLKLALSRLPVSYRFWQRLELFQHGKMEQPEYAWQVFQSHIQAAGARLCEPEYTILELGPGDTLSSALVATACGAASTLLVDVGPFARNDLKPYREMAEFLQGRGLTIPDISNSETLDQVLDACNAQYLTKGLQSLRSIADNSVDFVWSQAVLEHVRRADFAATMKELYRIMKPGGIASHSIDLKDHLGGALNNLRYSDARWEAEWMAKSGFYTNRFRYGEMIDMFCREGFDVTVDRTIIWDSIPTPRAKMHSHFANMDAADLSVSEFWVFLRRL